MDPLNPFEIESKALRSVVFPRGIGNSIGLWGTDMNFLLTGHKGFVGGAVMEYLSRFGYGFKWIERMKTFHLWHEKIETLFKENRFDAVIAAGAISDNQYKDPDIYTWNALATEILAWHCARQSIHLIFFSSQTARQPTTLYGHSKRLSETLIKAKPGLEACILQPFNIWGPSESVKPVHVRSLPFRLVTRNLEKLWRTQRDYVHVCDVVNAVFHAIEVRATGTFEVGTGNAVHADDLAACTPWRGYEKEPTPPYIQEWACADPKKFLPGWHPTIAVLEEMPRLEEEIHGKS